MRGREAANWRVHCAFSPILALSCAPKEVPLGCTRLSLFRLSASALIIVRLLVVSLGVVAAGCATTATDQGQAVIRTACDQRVDCFYERAVRDFEVLDHSTLVVFVGSERCPYRVTVDGFFCDLRMSAFISFRDADGRICRLDRSFIVGGPFTREDETCQIRDVEPLNDDELLETYVSYGLVEPLPATGSGELEVIEIPGERNAAPGIEELPASAD